MDKIRKILKKVYLPYAAIKIQNYRLGALYKSYSERNKERLISEIIQDYHVVEKGLTMPKMKLGFGKKVVLRLIHEIILYVNNFDIDNKQLKVAISVVFEYEQVHAEHQFKLDKDVVEAINLVSDLGIEVRPSNQINLTRQDFFRHCQSNFKEFSFSRNTIRNFKEDGNVSIGRIKEAIKLAQNAPSACNRQSVRLKLITDKKLLKKLFEIQSGNRGFGNLIDKLIIVSTDMSYWNYVTTIGGYIDSGIYMMNLLYSLHYYEIGACTLNTLFTKEQDLKVRQLIQLSSTEVITGFIGIGEPSENLRIANSARNNYEDILTIIN